MRIAGKLALVLVASSVAAEPCGLPSLVLPPGAEIRRGTLDDGMRYVVARRAEPPGRLEARIVVAGGFSAEAEGESGLAHLCEHLAFRGSEHFPPGAMKAHFDALGLPMGHGANASTSLDRIVYQVTHPCRSPDEMKRALDVVSDLAGGAIPTQEGLDAERSIVLEELRAAGARLDQHDAWLKAAFAGSALAHVSVTDARADLPLASLDFVRAFCRRIHRPDATTLVVVGDFDPGAIEQAIRSRLGSRAPPLEPAPLPPAIDLADDIRVVTMSGPGAETADVSLSHVVRCGSSGAGGSDAGFLEGLAVQVAIQVLRGRLAALAARGESPILQAMLHDDDVGLGLRTIGIHASVADSRVAESIRAMTSLVEDLRERDIEPAELASACARLERERDALLARSAEATSAAWADALAQRALDDLHGIQGDDVVAGWTEALRSLTPQQVRIAWADVLDPAVRVALAWCAREGCTNAEEVSEAWSSARRAPQPAMPVRSAASASVAVPSRPGQVRRRRDSRSLEARLLTLSNGARVILRRSEEGGSRIVGIAPGGTFGLDGRSKAACALLGSTLEMDRAADVEPELAAEPLGARLTCESFHRSLTAHSDSGDLATMLRGVHRAFAPPPLRAGTLEKARSLHVGHAAAAAEEKAVALDRELQARLLDDDARHEPASQTDLESVTPDDLGVAHAAWLSDPAEWTFVILGDLDGDAMERLAVEQLGGIARPPRPLPRRVNASELTRRAGIRARAEGGLRRADLDPGGGASTRIAVRWDARHARDLGAAMDVAKLLTLRLDEGLRESLAGTYSVFVDSLEMPSRGGPCWLIVSFESAPDRRAELSREARLELRELSESGPSETEVARLRELNGNLWRRSMAVDAFWLDLFTDAILRGDDPESRLAVPRQIERTTARRLKRALRRCLRPDTTFEIWASPDEAPPPSEERGRHPAH